jgi:purine-binding chemotaxis protein CheW
VFDRHMVENVLTTRRERYSPPTLASETGDMSLLFRAGAHLCALPLGRVVETMRPLPVEAVAGTPAYVRGLAIIRGAPVPVVDVARLLDRTNADPGAERWARFVTVTVAGRVIALAVDGVVGVRSLALASLRELPPLLREAEAGVVESIGTLDAELLLVLRGARLVPGDLMDGEEPS